MPKFKYTAVDSKGQLYKGTVEAASIKHVNEMLKEDGLTPVKITKATVFDLSLLKEVNIGGIPLKEKVFLFKQFSLMLEAGLPISRILDILTNQSSYPPIKRALEQIKNDVLAGVKLHEAFAKFPELFDNVTLALVKAGEESGKLDFVMKKISRRLSKHHKLVSSVRSALAYPVVVLAIIVLVLLFITVVVMPQMRSVFSEFNINLPLTTRLIFGLSESLIRFWYIYVAGVIVLIIGGYALLKVEGVKRFIDLLLPKIPKVGTIYTQIQLANITSTLGLLFEAGVPVIRALELAKDVSSNYWYRLELEELAEHVKKGQKISTYLAKSKMFPPLVRYMFEIGEESGKLGDSVQKVAQFYEQEVMYALKNISSIIQPILILILGVVIGVIVLSIYLPLSQLAQHIT